MKDVRELMLAPAISNPGPYEALVRIFLRSSRRRGESPTCHGRKPVAKRAPLLFWRQSRRRIYTYTYSYIHTHTSVCICTCTRSRSHTPMTIRGLLHERQELPNGHMGIRGPRMIRF
ncbi:uncharacterized protein BDW70DRAFT_140044 [Aspergillus foveolatus]|uniref:uncharacterized protein n=1 Tax=Aspergillus foveolatus TaxID=210207 RepID=UPI003CCD1F6B